MRDNAPVKNTCPIIDDVINYLEQIKKDCSTAISIREDIRSANQQLRDWGNEEYLRAEDLQEENDDLQQENDYITNLKED